MFEASRHWAFVGMRWDECVLGMLDDLEMQAEGLHLAERAVEVGELAVAQYAEVELVARLHASIGRAVHVVTTDGLDLRGRLDGAGSDWLLLLDDGGAGAWFVHLPFVVVVGGLSDRTVPAEARPLSARLSLRSVLRGLAADRQPAAIHLAGGRGMHGTVERVGADFVEIRQGDGGESVTVTVPVTAVVALHGRAGGA